MIDLKKELSETHNSLLTLELDDSDELTTELAHLEKGCFESSVEIKRKLSSPPLTPVDTPSSMSDCTGVKLPKLDVPTFDGNIMNWRSFWEQFRVSVHDRKTLSNLEKLVYLQHSLKGGAAKNIFEVLSHTGDHYSEAVKCLQTRFDRPRLIHQIHVRMISEAPALKDGSGKELRRLHDTTQQHLRALKSMGHEPPSLFITSLLELKLDNETIFEWQCHSQESIDVPHFTKLLEFLNLRAQASETCHKGSHRTGNRHPNPPRLVASFATNTSDSSSNCVLCATIKHPLYACPIFKSLSHDEMISTLKDNKLCLNCLKPGHFVRECKSLRRCRQCQKPHHTLLHVEPKDSAPNQSPASSSVAPSITGIQLSCTSAIPLGYWSHL